MESVWDKIEQCEKRLNDMEGTAAPQPDQGDSATDDQVKVCKNVFYHGCFIVNVLFILYISLSLCRWLHTHCMKFHSL